MNATSVLVLILILAFVSDRLTKAILFCLALIPKWRKAFPAPDLIMEPDKKYIARRKHLFAYTLIVGTIASMTVYFFPDIRMIGMLLGRDVSAVLDIFITTLIVMGGSDLVSRIVQISGIGDVGAVSAAGETSNKNKPVEIVGRLVVENEGKIWSAEGGASARNEAPPLTQAV